MKRLRLCLTLTLALLLTTSSVASAGRNQNPGVLPPNSRVQGLTYGEWSAEWWQEALAIPCDENPMCGNLGPNCYFARSGNVGLGVAGGGTFTYQCEIPTGMKLLVLVLAVECSTLEPPPFYGGNEEELRACAHSFIPVDLQASIDGVAVQNLSDYLVTSPMHDFTVPGNNFLGVPAGSGKSVAYGTWLMLTPFTPGEHTMHLVGAYPDFAWDWTFEITVTPGH